MRTLFENKFIRMWTFKNVDKIPMIAVEFVVDEASANSYRGFSIKKSRKVAKWFRKLAKKLEKVC